MIDVKQLEMKNWVLSEIAKRGALDLFKVEEEKYDFDGETYIVYSINHKTHQLSIEIPQDDDVEIYYKGQWIRATDKKVIKGILSDPDITKTEKDLVKSLKKVLKRFSHICNSTGNPFEGTVCGFKIIEDNDIKFEARLYDLVNVEITYFYDRDYRVLIRLYPNDYLQSFLSHALYFTEEVFSVKISNLEEITRIIDNKESIIMESQLKTYKFLEVDECYGYADVFIEVGYYSLEAYPAWIVPKSKIRRYINITEEEFDKMRLEEIKKIEKDLENLTDKEFYEKYYKCTKEKIKRDIEEIKKELSEKHKKSITNIANLKKVNFRRG